MRRLILAAAAVTVSTAFSIACTSSSSTSGPTAGSSGGDETPDGSIDDDDAAGDAGPDGAKPPNFFECAAGDFLVKTATQVISFSANDEGAETALYIALNKDDSLDDDLRRYVVKSTSPCTLERDPTFSNALLPTSGQFRIGADKSLWKGGASLTRLLGTKLSYCDVDPSLDTNTTLGAFALEPSGTAGYIAVTFFEDTTPTETRFARFTVQNDSCSIVPTTIPVAPATAIDDLMLDKAGRIWTLATVEAGGMKLEVRSADAVVVTKTFAELYPLYGGFHGMMSPCGDGACVLSPDGNVLELGSDGDVVKTETGPEPAGGRFRPAAISGSTKGLFLAGTHHATGAADNGPSAARIWWGKPR
jgi:hypothetical protein